MKARTLLTAITALVVVAMLYFLSPPGKVASPPVKQPATLATVKPVPLLAQSSVPDVLTVPSASSAAPATSPSASADDLTSSQKALLTRQALAAGQSAPKFSDTSVDSPPANLTPLERSVMDLLPGMSSSTNYQEIEIFELEPGATSSYRIRDDVVTIPVPSAGLNVESIPTQHVIYYVPSINHFYIVWEGAGASTLHYHGPFNGNPYEMLGVTPPENPRP